MLTRQLVGLREGSKTDLEVETDSKSLTLNQNKIVNWFTHIIYLVFLHTNGAVFAIHLLREIFYENSHTVGPGVVSL